MTRAIEPYREGAPDVLDRTRPTRLPERFARWVEILRTRIALLPVYTYQPGSPEAVITGQQGDLYYDTTGNTWYTKTTAAGNTGWRQLVQLLTSTDTALEAIGDVINTSPAKVAGLQIFNTTTGAPVWAAGAADDDVWVDATGATAHTPV